MPNILLHMPTCNFSVMICCTNVILGAGRLIKEVTIRLSANALFNYQLFNKRSK